MAKHSSHRTKNNISPRTRGAISAQNFGDSGQDFTQKRSDFVHNLYSKPLTLPSTLDYSAINDGGHFVSRQTISRRLPHYETRYFHNDGRVSIPTRGHPMRTWMQYLPHSVQDNFSIPTSASTCVRRSVRRSVLFAMSRAGQGIHRPVFRGRWTPDSYVQCKKTGRR